MKTTIRTELSEPHPHLGALISSYQDGLASPEEAARIERHLADCSNCHHFYHNLELSRRLVGRLPPLPTGEGSEAATLREVLARAAGRRPRKVCKERKAMDYRRYFERFSPAAGRVIEQTGQEARRLGHDYIGTEHLLLGLLAAEDVAAGRGLAGRLTLEGARKWLEKTTGPGRAASGGELPLTPRLKRVFELAGQATPASQPLEPAHLLLGLAIEKEGLAAYILEQAGISTTELRRELERDLNITGNDYRRQGLLARLTGWWRKL